MSKFDRGELLIFGLVFVSGDFELHWYATLRNLHGGVDHRSVAYGANFSPLTFVWPAVTSRPWYVARGSKRLCTTVIEAMDASHFPS